MNKNVKIFAIIVIFAAAAAFVVYSATRNPEESNMVGGDRDEHGCIPSAGYSWCEARQVCLRPWEEYCTSAQPKTVVFNCADSKSIIATFYITDDKYVDLVLSDGRKLSVARAISASGARYANADESFVFWNKGDTAFITEGPDSLFTYTGCLLGQ
jgi:membrane-bound inhibitor of C-type lysozyme